MEAFDESFVEIDLQPEWELIYSYDQAAQILQAATSGAHARRTRNMRTRNNAACTLQAIMGGAHTRQRLVPHEQKQLIARQIAAKRREARETRKNVTEEASQEAAGQAETDAADSEQPSWPPAGWVGGLLRTCLHSEQNTARKQCAVGDFTQTLPEIRKSFGNARVEVRKPVSVPSFKTVPKGSSATTRLGRVVATARRRALPAGAARIAWELASAEIKRRAILAAR